MGWFVAFIMYLLGAYVTFESFREYEQEIEGSPIIRGLVWPWLAVQELYLAIWEQFNNGQD